MIYDPTFTFTAHAASVARRASARMNILKALSDSTFGKDKECLLLSYRVFIRSILNYAAPITYPNYSPSSIAKLQKIQNRALRICLGCHSASSVDHLHTEAKELKVEDHLRLLSAQFLASCLQPHHPSHLYVRLDNGRRNMKETLQSKVSSLVDPYLDANGCIAPGTYHPAISDIHRDVVTEAIGKLAPNRVLNRRAPDIDKRENYLPKITRLTLSQLRSGFCARLQTYQLKIGKSQSDLCPLCDSAPHTTNHLFECPARRTTLTVESLWTDTWAAANFLSSLPSFEFLPSPGPPPPPPPRRYPARRPPPEPPDEDPFSPLPLPPSPFVYTPPPLSPPPPRIRPLMPPPSPDPPDRPRSQTPLRGTIRRDRGSLSQLI